MSVAAIGRQRSRLSIGAVSRSPLLPLGVFIACLLWRAPRLVTAPRFWAEEGSLYFSHMRQVGWPEALLTVVNGNYQVLTNLATAIAALVPARLAAHVTTSFGLLVAAGCGWLLSRFLLDRGISMTAACVGAALFAWQPGGYEVFLNATNLQWVTSVVALLLCLSEDAPALGPSAILRYLALLACGLNGTTSCILLPVFLVSALWRRGAFRWGMVLVLGACTAIQLAVVIAHRNDIHRPLLLQARSALAAVFQALFAIVVPANVLDSAGAGLVDPSRAGNAAAVQVFLLGCLGLVLLALGASRRLGRKRAVLIVMALAGTCAVNAFGALAPADGMLSGWAGARYFFAGSSCTIILLASCLDDAATEVRIAAYALALLAVSNGCLTACFARWNLLFIHGPSLERQVDGCEPGRDCVVQAWPATGAFTIDLGRFPPPAGLRPPSG